MIEGESETSSDYTRRRQGLCDQDARVSGRHRVGVHEEKMVACRDGSPALELPAASSRCVHDDGSGGACDLLRRILRSAIGDNDFLEPTRV